MGGGVLLLNTSVGQSASFPISGPLFVKKIRKVCRDTQYLAFVPLQPLRVWMGGDAPTNTLSCKYGAVLQKIGLECSAILSELAKDIS